MAKVRFQTALCKMYLHTSITILAIFAGIGCAEKDNVDHYAEARVELEAQKQNWQSLQITDYSYVGTLACECLSPYHTGPIKLVYTNQTLDTSPYVNKQDIPDESFEAYFNSISQEELMQMKVALTDQLAIEAIFERIESALIERVDSFCIEYHEQFHFPTTIFLDPNFKTADEEFIIKLEEFNLGD